MTIAGRARTLPLILGALHVFVTFQAPCMGVPVIAGEDVLGTRTWWDVAIGNLVAAPTMGYYIRGKDPVVQVVLARPYRALYIHGPENGPSRAGVMADLSNKQGAIPLKNPIRVAVTGAAGQIGYALLPRIASGEMLGTDREVILQLVEIPPAMDALRGVAMELDDCAFPLLREMILSEDPRQGFEGAHLILLVGAKPRGKGQQRGDLIRDNGPIFVGQGRAIAESADDEVRVAVVGNPANTNALIAMANATGLPRERFTAMTRLDENRAAAQLAGRAGVEVSAVTNVAIWGNHSATQYPDFENARIGGRPVTEVIGDREWLEGDFLGTVQKRGAAIIEARGQSSAMSAASALVDHVRDWMGGTPTPADDWVSMAVPSDGSYGIEEGLISSFPVRTDGHGGYEIVQGLDLSTFARERVDASVQELAEERSVVEDLLGSAPAD